MKEGKTVQRVKSLNVARWILFVPLSLICSWFIDSIIVPVGYSGDLPAVVWLVYLEILSAILRGIVIILIAYLVIPKKKKTTLLIYSILCSVYVFAMSFIEEIIEGIANFGWFEIIIALILIISAWLTYFVIKFKFKDDQKIRFDPGNIKVV